MDASQMALAYVLLIPVGMALYCALLLGCRNELGVVARDDGRVSAAWMAGVLWPILGLILGLIVVLVVLVVLWRTPFIIAGRRPRSRR